MENLPLFIVVVFCLTTILTLYIFYRASRSKLTIAVLVTWLIIQGIIASTGFYTITNGFPPKFLFLVAPPLLTIIMLFATQRGRNYLDSLEPGILTLLHIVRIPVELVLFWLFVHHAVPRLMTFEGRNLDILSGLSAPLIYYFGYIKRSLGKKFLLLWNVICLGLLFNIVIHAALALPTPFQQIGFEQPNIAVLHFPFVWLPGFIVPVVLLSHLVGIRKIMLSPEKRLETINNLPGTVV